MLPMKSQYPGFKLVVVTFALDDVPYSACTDLRYFSELIAITDLVDS